MSIKTIIASSALLLGVGFTANAQFAQKLSIGPAVGVNYTWMNGPGESTALAGLTGGLNVTYSTNEKWGIGTGVHYSQEGGYNGTTANEDAKSRFNYVRVPLKLYHFFGTMEDNFRPKIYAGPQVGFLVSTKQGTNDVISTINNSTYEKVDVGGVLGTGFNYRIREGLWFNMDVAYRHGFTQIAPDIRNRGLGATIGISTGIQ